MMFDWITRDTAIRVLRELEALVHEDVKRAAASGALPRAPGSYAMWTDKRDEQLRTIEALRALVKALPPGTVFDKGEAA